MELNVKRNGNQIIIKRTNDKEMPMIEMEYLDYG